MGRRASKVPQQLLTGAPVTLGDARRHGLGPWRLQTAGWHRIGPGTYLPSGQAETHRSRLEAASRRLPPRAAFSGFTAAWIHGLDVNPCDPIEVTIAAPTTVSTRAGMVVRRRSLDQGDIVEARGFRVISIGRTLRELCHRMNLTEAVVLADMALHDRLVSVDELERAALPSKVLRHLEPASESPMETRLRMLLVLSGLPRPQAQVSIRNRWRQFAGRLDLYYAEQRLGLEYDGATHRVSLTEDNRRQNRLLQAGVRLLRFTAADLVDGPEKVVAAVRTALAA